MYQFHENITGKECSVKTELFLYKNNNHLIFEYSAYSSSLNSYSDKDNDSLYEGDVVELFLDVGEPNTYFEIEVAPNGASFIAKIKDGDIIFIDGSFVKTNSIIKGDSYFVTIDIDISQIKIIQPIRFNAYRIETKKIKRNYILSALNPTLTDSFHVKERFVFLSDYLNK